MSDTIKMEMDPSGIVNAVREIDREVDRMGTSVTDTSAAVTRALLGIDDATDTVAASARRVDAAMQAETNAMRDAAAAADALGKSSSASAAAAAKQADQIAALQRQYEQQVAALNMTQGGTKKLTREQQAQLDIMRQGIDASSDLGQAMVELAGDLDDLEAGYKRATREAEELEQQQAAQQRAIEREADAINRLSRERDAYIQTMRLTEGGTVSLTRVGQAQVEMQKQGVDATSELGRAMLAAARDMDAVDAGYEAVAAAAEQAEQAQREAAAAAERAARETKEQADAIDRLEREYRAEAKALALSAGGTRVLTREQKALVKLTLDGIPATSKMGKAAQAAARDLDQLDKEIADNNKRMTRFNRLSDKVGGSLAGIATTVAATAGAYVGAGRAYDFFAESLNQAADYETARLSLETLLGTAEAADQRLEELVQLADTTPFELPGLLESERQLLAMGGAALGSMENLTLVGDASAALGRPLEDMTRWFGRGRAAIEAGLPLGEVQSELTQLGVAIPSVTRELEQMRQSGASQDEIWERFISQFARTSGAMAALSGTFSGNVSTMRDTWSGFQRAVGQSGVKEAAQQIVQEMTAVATQAKESEQLVSDLGQFGAEALFTAADAALSLVDAGASVYRAWLTVSGIAQQTTYSIIEGFWSARLSALEFRQGVIDSLLDSSEAAHDFGRDMIEAVEPVATLVGGTFAASVDAAKLALTATSDAANGVAELSRRELEGLREDVALLSATAEQEARKNAERYAASAELSAKADATAASLAERREKTMAKLADTTGNLTKKTDALAKATAGAVDRSQELSAEATKLQLSMQQETLAIQTQLDYYGRSADEIKVLTELIRTKKDITSEAATAALEQARALDIAKQELKKKTDATEAAKKELEAYTEAQEAGRLAIAALAIETEIQASIIQRTMGGYYELTQVEQAHYDLMREGIPVWSAMGIARLTAAKRIDDLTESERRNREQRELDDSIERETEALRRAALEIDKTERELLQLEAASMRAAGASEHVVREWLAASEAAIRMREASEDATVAAQLYADVAGAAVNTVLDAGLRVWDDQIDGFDGFKDHVLDGLEDILKQMLVISATQWALPEGLGGVGGAFSGFSGTDLGRLLSGGQSILGGGGALGGINIGSVGGQIIPASNVTEVLGAVYHTPASSTPATGLMSYLGPALAGLAIGGTLLTGIDSLADGGLFGTSWDELSRTVELAVTGGIVSGYERVERTRERSLFRGSQTEVTETALGVDMLAGVQTAYDHINNVLIQSAADLGLGAAQTLLDTLGEEFSVGVVGGEDYFGAITRHLVRMGERIARDVAPGIELAANAGEDLVSALHRVAATGDIVEATLDPLGVSIESLISSDYVAGVVEDYSQYLINELQAGALTSAVDGWDPLGVGFEMPADGIFTDEMRAEIEAQAALLAASMGLSTEQIAATMLEGVDAFNAARVVYIDALSDLAGGTDALQQDFAELSGFWQTTTESAGAAIEAAIGRSNDGIAATLEELGTSQQSYWADFNAAMDDALSPEQLLQWVDLGNDIATILQLEQELARIRGEALQLDTLSADQRAAVADQTATLNETIAALGLSAVATDQGLLNLNATIGDMAAIQGFLAQAQAEFMPEADRAALQMEQLTEAATALGLDLGQSVEDIRAQYLALIDEAILAGDGDQASALQAILQALDDYLDDLEAGQQAVIDQQAEAARAAEQAAARMADLHSSLDALALGISYTDDAAQALADQLGGLDAVAGQWSLVFNEFFDAEERAALTMATVGEQLAASEIDLQRLADGGLAYYRDLLLQAHATQDAAREATLLDLADEVLSWVRAGEQLGDVSADAVAGLDQLAAAVADVQASVNDSITRVAANGLVPTGQLEIVEGQIAAIMARLGDTTNLAEAMQLQQQLEELEVSRFELLRDGVIGAAEEALSAENDLIRRRNEAQREIYQADIARYRDMQRLIDDVSGYSADISNVGVAPIVDFGASEQRFFDAVEAVLAGQSDGAGLTSAADDYLQLAEQILGSTTEFFDIRDAIQSALGDVAGYAGSVDAPEEPADIPLLQDIMDSSNVSARASREIATLQEQSITALERIGDDQAKLARLIYEEEEQHRATEADHMAVLQDWLTATTQASADDNAKRAATDDDSRDLLADIERHTDASLDAVRDIGTTLGAGGISLDDRAYELWERQTGILHRIETAVRAIESINSYGFFALESKSWTPIVNVTIEAPETPAHDEETEVVEEQYA